MNALSNKTRSTLLLLAGLLFAFLPMGWGNNIQVSNVSIEKPQGQTYWNVKFNLSWNNSWNNSTSKDGAWIFVKYRKVGTATWHHAFLSNTGHSSGSGCSTCAYDLGLRTPGSPNTYHEKDNPALGVFFYDNATHSIRENGVSVSNLQLRWNYTANDDIGAGGRPLSANDQVQIKVYAIEMVHIPTGDFRLGGSDDQAVDRFTASDGGPVVVSSNDVFSTQSTLLETSFSSWSSGKSFSGNINVPDRPGRMLVVGISWRKEDLKSLKIGGTDLILLEDDSKGDNEVRLYYLPDPAVGNNTITATFDKNPDASFMHISVFGHSQAPDSGSSKNGNKASVGNLTLNGLSVGDRIAALANTKGSSFTSVPGRNLSSGTHTDLISVYSELVAIQQSTALEWAWQSDKDYVLAAVGLPPSSSADALISPGLTINGSTGISSGNFSNGQYPTGYSGFLCMKYEITQGQYVSFLNTLTIAQQTQRTFNDPAGHPSGTPAMYNSIADRNGIVIQTPADIHPAIYACNLNEQNTFDQLDDGQHIACNYLSVEDVTAWLDWAALRPMTEMEYEKACRGDSNNPHKYPWGSNTAPTPPGGTNDFELLGTANEAPKNGVSCNATCNSTLGGPTRAGAYARPAGHSSNKTRAAAGAAITGILDLIGNVWELVVTAGNETGRSYSGTHGDGTLSTSTDWPANAGFVQRGGSWKTINTSEANYMMVSDRSNPAYEVPLSGRQSDLGGRGVRSH